jgi:hypothetical protein
VALLLSGRSPRAQQPQRRVAVLMPGAADDPEEWTILSLWLLFRTTIGFVDSGDEETR